jgi:hypothetical protein
LDENLDFWDRKGNVKIEIGELEDPDLFLQYFNTYTKAKLKANLSFENGEIRSKRM